MMRTPRILAGAFLAALTLASGSAWAAGTQSSTQQRIASTSCGDELRMCLASNTQTDANGVKYVPPDAAEACHAAYRRCTSHR